MPTNSPKRQAVRSMRFRPCRARLGLRLRRHRSWARSANLPEASATPCRCGRGRRHFDDDLAAGMAIAVVLLRGRHLGERIDARRRRRSKAMRPTPDAAAPARPPRGFVLPACVAAGTARRRHKRPERTQGTATRPLPQWRMVHGTSRWELNVRAADQSNPSAKIASPGSGSGSGSGPGKNSSAPISQDADAVSSRGRLRWS